MIHNGVLILDPLVVSRERKRILLNTIHCFVEGDGFEYLSRYDRGLDLSETKTLTFENISEKTSDLISKTLPSSSNGEVNAFYYGDGSIILDSDDDTDYTNPANKEKFLPGLENRVLVESLQSTNEGVWLNDEIINTSFQLISEAVPDNRVGCIYSYQIDAVDRTVGTMWQLDKPLNHYDKLIVPGHVSQGHWIFVCVEIGKREIIIFDSLNKTYPFHILTTNFVFAKKVQKLLKRNADFHGLTGYNDWQIYERQAPKQYNTCDCGLFTILSAECSVNNREMTFSQATMPSMRARIRHIFENFQTVSEKWFYVPQSSSQITQEINTTPIQESDDIGSHILCEIPQDQDYTNSLPVINIEPDPRPLSPWHDRLRSRTPPSKFT